jgi:hypothetical protein
MQLLIGYSPAINSTVTVTNVVNLYAYRTTTLLLSYGMTLLVAVIANVLGSIAFLRNGYSYDRGFSSIVSATNNTTLLEDPHHHRRGSWPLPLDAKKMPVSFGDLPGGGVGFQPAHPMPPKTSGR